MGRPKGSKNKSKVECLPPEDRGSPVQSTDTPCKGEAFDVSVKYIYSPSSPDDGAYLIGKRANGKTFVAKLGWANPIPQTKELLKKLGLDQ